MLVITGGLLILVVEHRLPPSRTISVTVVWLLFALHIVDLDSGGGGERRLAVGVIVLILNGRVVDAEFGGNVLGWPSVSSSAM